MGTWAGAASQSQPLHPFWVSVSLQQTWDPGVSAATPFHAHEREEGEGTLGTGLAQASGELVVFKIYLFFIV